MTPNKIFEEYAYQLKRTDCKSILDHDVNWCGDCYACANCGKKFITAIVANEALLSERKQTEEHSCTRDEDGSPTCICA